MTAMVSPKFVVTAACMLALAACVEDASQTVSRPVTATRVVVEPLQFEDTRTRVEAVGTSRAIRSIELHPATSGEVIAVNFDPGQRVSKGAILLALDQRDEELNVALAQIRLQDAERLYDRYSRTGSSGAVLPTTIDTAKTAVESARVELERAKVALDYRTIEAPFDGFVNLTEVESGDRINPDTQITTLDDRSALLVSFEVPEVLSGQLTVGDDVTIATWNNRSSPLVGRIVEIGSRIDPATRTFTLRARVDNDADDLRPGMSFRVSVDIDGTPYPAIRETAVQWGADGAYVWSADNGRARRVSVDIKQRQQGRVLVDGDLDHGDLIIVQGIQRMREGTELSYEPTSVTDRRLDDADIAAPSADD